MRNEINAGYARWDNLQSKESGNSFWIWEISDNVKTRNSTKISDINVRKMKIVQGLREIRKKSRFDRHRFSFDVREHMKMRSNKTQM